MVSRQRTIDICRIDVQIVRLDAAAVDLGRAARVRHRQAVQRGFDLGVLAVDALDLEHDLLAGLGDN